MQFKYVKLNDFPGVETYFLHTNRKPYIILRFDETERWKIMLTDKDGNMRSIVLSAMSFWLLRTLAIGPMPTSSTISMSLARTAIPIISLRYLIASPNAMNGSVTSRSMSAWK